MNKQGAALKRLVPSPVRRLLRRTYYAFLDVFDASNRDELTPPRGLMLVGGGDFKEIGEGIKESLVKLGGLKPGDRILDVGSGNGRVAVPLTKYLSPEGEYWGLDIVKAGIDWCNSRIASRYGNFHFVHCNVYNEFYNPRGSIRGRDLRFPFEDKSFDFVFLASVFTHMLLSDIENYLHEISRVLKPNARLFATWFLLNAESRQSIASGSSTLDFKYELGSSLTIDKKQPEDAVAHREEIVLDLYVRNGLQVDGPFYYGNWSRRNVAQKDQQSLLESYQDIIVATRGQAI